MISLLSPDAVARDLTDPSEGRHALQLLIEAVTEALRGAWQCDVVVRRDGPIVSVEDCYDRLGYDPDAVSRSSRYTKYVSETCVLRTHTSAMIPPALRSLGGRPPTDLLLVCPGIVYRRDSIDRLHTGTPHQLDLWRVTTAAMTTAELDEMVALGVEALLPGVELRTTPVDHPYTEQGRQVDVRGGEEWVELAECGLAAPGVLAGAGLDPSEVTGLALGIGLDRALMLRKGIPDIRLLRSGDARVASQMLDLAPYRPVSSRPAVTRDLSLAVDANCDTELLGDRVRDALGDEAASVEHVEVLSETAAADLRAPAVSRLGIRAGQKNVLVRVVLRNLDRTLTAEEANILRDRVYAALHEGDAEISA